MQTGNYHHRNPYTQQPNANGVNGPTPNGIIVDGGAAQHINGDASPNTINVDPYNGTGDELQAQQPPVCKCESFSNEFPLANLIIVLIYFQAAGRSTAGTGSSVQLDSGLSSCTISKRSVFGPIYG